MQNRNKKKLIIISLITIVLILASTTVFAFYQLNRSIKANGSYGKINSCSIDLYELTNRGSLDNESALYSKIEDAREGYSDGVLYCYASERKSYNQEDYVEVRNLKAVVNIDTQIDTYIRVKIKDSWSSYRIYNSGTKKNEIIPKQSQAFELDSLKWYYDESSGYAYYKQIVNGQLPITMFDYSNYLYQLKSSSTYRETIFVSVSFAAEAVQANRIESVFGVNPSLWQ